MKMGFKQWKYWVSNSFTHTGKRSSADKLRLRAIEKYEVKLQKIGYSPKKQWDSP